MWKFPLVSIPLIKKKNFCLQQKQNAQMIDLISKMAATSAFPAFKGRSSLRRSAKCKFATILIGPDSTTQIRLIGKYDIYMLEPQLHARFAGAGRGRAAGSGTLHTYGRLCRPPGCSSRPPFLLATGRQEGRERQRRWRK